jgi:hypothetical protein
MRVRSNINLDSIISLKAEWKSLHDSFITFETFLFLLLLLIYVHGSEICSSFRSFIFFIFLSLL